MFAWIIACFASVPALASPFYCRFSFLRSFLHFGSSAAAPAATLTPALVFEVEPATLRLRIATGIAHRHPELAARVQRRGGADRIAKSLAEGHARKR